MYLIELTGYNPDTALTETIPLTTEPNYITEPGDATPNTCYLPRVKESFNFERSLFSSGSTTLGKGSRSTGGFGVIKVNNDDGGLDGLINYGWDGRPFRVLSGDSRAAYDDLVQVFQGALEQAEFTWDEAIFRARDRQSELDVPIQATKYAGTNSGATGVEGLATDIKGKPKVIALGPCPNVPAVCVNTVKRIYQVNDGAINAVSAVYDSGAALTFSADYADLAALQAATVGAGYYATCLALGLIRLGATPAGQVTADVQGDKTGGTYYTSAADLAKHVILTRTSMTASDLNTSTFTALNTKNSAPVCLWIDSETTVAEVLDRLLGSIGAWWIFGRDGKLSVGRFEAPSGSAVASFGTYQILAITKQATNDSGDGVPAYRVILEYGRNWTVQESGLAGSVSDARRAVLAESCLTATSTDATVKTAHKMAIEMPFATYLTDAADAQAEADRLLAIYKVRRDRFKVTLPADLGTGVDLGNVVSLTMERFGMDSGKLFAVIGMVEHFGDNKVELDLYG